jgi:uracil-DNA glycosylase
MKLRKNNWLEPYCERLRKRTGITRLQGSPSAETFLIAPVPGKDELSQNLAWCNRSASRFFMWMNNQIGLKSNDDFLIMPCTFDGDKPKKGNTDIGLDIAAAAAQSKSIKRFVIVGGDAFKTYFGYGKKPSMDSLVGHIMFLQQADFKPLFVFPDLWALSFDAEAPYPSKRDFFKAQAACKEYMDKLDRLTEQFKKFLTTEKP